MHTLALLKGKMDSAGDELMQRFKSRCLALRDGTNHFARYLELLPEDLLGGGASMEETNFARTMAVREARADSLLKKSAGTIP